MCNKLDERFAFAISHFPICEIEMEVEQKMISKIEEREKKMKKKNLLHVGAQAPPGG